MKVLLSNGQVLIISPARGRFPPRSSKTWVSSGLTIQYGVDPFTGGTVNGMLYVGKLHTYQYYFSAGRIPMIGVPQPQWANTVNLSTPRFNSKLVGGEFFNLAMNPTVFWKEIH